MRWYFKGNGDSDKDVSPFANTFKKDLSISEETFCLAVTKLILTDILTETYDRVKFPNKSKYHSVFFRTNFVDDNQIGIIDLIVDSMIKPRRRYLVFNDQFLFIRDMTAAEMKEAQKRQRELKPLAPGHLILDYTNSNLEIASLIMSAAGIFYNILSADNTATYVSKSVILKLAGMTENISNKDMDILKAQVKIIDDALRDGRTIFVDAESEVTFPDPKVTASESSFENVMDMMAFFTRMTKGWLSGDSKSGSFNAGESDSVAIERGLKIYFNYYMKPVVDKLLKVDCIFSTSILRNVAKRTPNFVAMVEESSTLSDTDKSAIVRDILDAPSDM